VSGSLDDRATDDGESVAPADLRERLAAFERTGAVVGYAPLLDYDELGIRTVVTRLAARERCVDAVAEDLRGRNVTDVYVVTGEYDVVAIGRFADRGAVDAHLARLATDDRVLSVTATVTLDTVREYDAFGLLDVDALPD
jgi:DNA-binding Lrp family transcriptional regulator